MLLKKDFEGGSLSNIDSRRVPNEQHRFKNPFARIRLFQILIPQLRFGDFFNSIGHERPKDDVCAESVRLPTAYIGRRGPEVALVPLPAIAVKTLSHHGALAIARIAQPLT